MKLFKFFEMYYVNEKKKIMKKSSFDKTEYR